MQNRMSRIGFPWIKSIEKNMRALYYCRCRCRCCCLFSSCSPFLMLALIGKFIKLLPFFTTLCNDYYYTILKSY